MYKIFISIMFILTIIYIIFMLNSFNRKEIKVNNPWKNIDPGSAVGYEVPNKVSGYNTTYIWKNILYKD